MKLKAVGFYWTLPVPWARFTQLPRDIDAAARESQTIRYQRAVIDIYARENGLELIHEEVYLEVRPDGGSKLVGDTLDKLATLCEMHNAILLFVDFSKPMGWRSHHWMREWFDQTPVHHVSVPAEPMDIDGKTFDPNSHFASWRNRQKAWSDAKAERKAKALAEAGSLQSEGLSLPEIARRLGERGIRSPTGREWTADNLSRFLRNVEEG